MPVLLRGRCLLSTLLLLLTTAVPATLLVRTAPAQAAPVGSAARFAPLQEPVRVLDTRSGRGATRERVPAGGTRDIPVAGQPGVPEGATAAVLNVAIVGAEGDGHVSAYPAGTDGRGTGVLGHTGTTPIIATLATVPLGQDGRVTLFTSSGGHLVADLFGVYVGSGATTAGRFVPLTPSRLVDTRDGRGAGRYAAGTSRPLTLSGQAGLPASGVTAVALNVTAVAMGRAGFLQVRPPGGGGFGSYSNIATSLPGQTLSNLVIVAVDPRGDDAGQVQVYSSQDTDVVVDVAGYFTGDTAAETTAGLFQAVQPSRELDTREPSPYYGTTGRPAPAGSQQVVNMTSRRSLPSGGVAAVVLGVTAVAPRGGGHVSTFPTGDPTGGQSATLGYAPGQIIANSALVPLGRDGRVSLSTSTTTHLVADVFGYYLAAPDDPLAGLRVAEADTTVPYDRRDWPHWTDEDRDCQDARAEVLLEETLTPVTFTSATGCTVASGRWIDPYADREWSAASDLDVDHVVPLANAHRSGAHAWDRARRQAFANDLVHGEHLSAVEDGLNQSKGDRGPEAWKPPARSFWCLYATGWAQIKERWDLSVTAAELAALREMLATCDQPGAASGA